MPNYKEVSDGGSDPNTPSVKEMRKSQQRGAEGTGFDDSYADKQARRNHGTGRGEGDDPKFAEAEAGVDSDTDALPWE
jgi:hypothetical protein